MGLLHMLFPPPETLFPPLFPYLPPPTATRHFPRDIFSGSPDWANPQFEQLHSTFVTLDPIHFQFNFYLTID